MRDQNEYVVFDATDPGFYRGRVSLEFTKQAFIDGSFRPWFFQPVDWVPHPASDWYGSIAATLTETLVTYSPGYATREEAQAAADGWRETRARRAVRAAILDDV